MIDLVIVNWNSGDYLKKVIHCLEQQTLKSFKIIIIDNASSDLSIDNISCIQPLNIIRLDKNLGFSAANNLAIASSTAEHVALLNPDAFPEPQWLEKLICAAETNPRIAAFGSCQLQADSTDCIDGLGDIYHCSGLAWRNGYGRKLAGHDKTPSPVFSPCAGAALYRRDVLAAVGGFDEDFFCYMEDVDLGFRLQLAGYQAMYVPDAVVHHVGGASSGGSQSDFAIYHGHRNLVWVFLKNMPGILFWILLPLHIAMNISVIFWYAAKGKGQIIWRAKRDALSGLSKMWKKRQDIQSVRQASLAYIWRLLDKRIIRKRN